MSLRILHLTDMHLTRSWFAAYDRLLAAIRDARVDLICFTGDLVDSRWNPSAALPHAERFIQSLTSRLGTFVVLGNHDGDLLAPYLSRWRCHLLHPGRATLDFGAGMLDLIGLPGVSRKDAKRRILRKFGPKPADAVRIVLTHYPDHVRRLKVLAPDLVLTGHTHGGQVCLPGCRPLITHDSLPKRMSSGVHRVDDFWLVVSRGVGYATYPIRVFAPPEVIEVSLTRA